MQLMERSNGKSPEVLRALLSRVKEERGLSPVLTAEEVINPSIGFSALTQRGGAGAGIPSAPPSLHRRSWLEQKRAEIQAMAAELPVKPVPTLEKVLRAFDRGDDSRAEALLEDVEIVGSSADRERAGKLLTMMHCGHKEQAILSLVGMVGG
jgi:hypothetical protein